jgi:hypothetical protein
LVTGCARIYTAQIVISGFVRDMGIDYIRVAVPQGVPHLLGTVNFLDSNLAAVRSDTVTKEVLTVLRDFGIETTSCNAGHDISEGLGLGFVTREVVMPSRRPRLSGQLRPKRSIVRQEAPGE